MFPFLSEKSKPIKYYIDKGNYSDALNRLIELKGKLELDSKELLNFKLLETYLSILSGQKITALQLAEESLELGRDLQLDKGIFFALILKAEAVRHSSRFIGAEALRHPTVYSEITPEEIPHYSKLIAESEGIFNEIQPDETLEYLLMEAWLKKAQALLSRIKKQSDNCFLNLNHCLKIFEEIDNREGIASTLQSIALAFGIKGEIPKEIEYLQQSLKIYRELGIHSEIANLLLRIGVLLFHYMSKPKEGFKFLNEAYELSESLNDQSGAAVTLSFIGNMYTWLGELDRALKLLQRSLILSERIGNTESLAFTLNNIGWNYHIRGELNLALESLNRGVSLSREKQYPWIQVWNLSNIGFVYRAKNEFDTACGYYSHGISISEDIGDYLAMSWGLYQVIKLTIDTNSIVNTKKHLERLRTLSERYSIKLISQMYRNGLGMLLKRSPRIRDKAKAQEYFDQVTAEDIEAVEVTADAMLNRCELLLLEFDISDDEQVFKDVRKLTNELLELAEEQNSHMLLSETYLLKAELSVLQGDVKAARHSFAQAQMIAEEKGLHKLALSISREYDAFIDKIGQSSYVDEKSDQEAPELGKVTNLLDKMSTQSIIAVSDPPAIEDSIMLLIITEGGITIFSHFFKSKGLIKGPLVGSFLSAIEAFSKEVFSSSIERLTLGDYRLIINNSDSLTFAYVYLGESYTAIKRLKKFILTLQMNSDLWKALKNKVNTGMLLTSDEEAIIFNVIQSAYQ
ncbi:tetratricopeptide repeat protein [Candidatus Hodarchaeum mangrovi]